jgi:hypothetical protein
VTWIRVEDQLPPFVLDKHGGGESDDVLCVSLNEKGGVRFYGVACRMTFRGANGRWYWRGSTMVDGYECETEQDVTHWMPLPPPPVVTA